MRSRPYRSKPVVSVPPPKNDMAEETLVEDPRSRASPSQQIERKLLRLMKSSPIMVSQMQRSLKRRPR